MITINEIHHHTLDYECSCGTLGECMFKPPDGNTIMLIEVKCPMCEASERVEIMKYDSEKGKKELLSKEAQLDWVIVIDNKIKEN